MNNEELEYYKYLKEQEIKEKDEEIRELKNTINQAKEYIKDRFFINEETGEYYLTHTFDDSNLYELMKILKG